MVKTTKSLKNANVRDHIAHIFSEMGYAGDKKTAFPWIEAQWKKTVSPSNETLTNDMYYVRSMLSGLKPLGKGALRHVHSCLGLDAFAMSFSELWFDENDELRHLDDFSRKFDEMRATVIDSMTYFRSIPTLDEGWLDIHPDITPTASAGPSFAPLIAADFDTPKSRAETGIDFGVQRHFKTGGRAFVSFKPIVTGAVLIACVRERYAHVPQEKRFKLLSSPKFGLPVDTIYRREAAIDAGRKFEVFSKTFQLSEAPCVESVIAVNIPDSTFLHLRETVQSPLFKPSSQDDLGDEDFMNLARTINRYSGHFVPNHERVYVTRLIVQIGDIPPMRR